MVVCGVGACGCVGLGSSRGREAEVLLLFDVFGKVAQGLRKCEIV